MDDLMLTFLQALGYNRDEEPGAWRDLDFGALRDATVSGFESFARLHGAFLDDTLAGPTTRRPSATGLDHAASLISRVLGGKFSQPPGPDPIEDFFPPRAEVPTAAGSPEAFVGLHAAVWKETFPFTKRMLEAYLDPERQRAWGVAGEAWGRSLWDVDAATPDDAYLQRVDAYREAFAEPLGQALSLLFWQLDSKVIRGRLAQDHAFLDRMLECVLQSPEVQDFAWSETRSAMERFAAGAGAGHNLMFVTLPLLESSGPYREHVRHEAEQGRTPAAARALFELTQMVVPPDEPGMLGGTRFGEEFAVLEALAFDRVSIPKVVELAAQHGVDLEGYALMDFEDLRRKQDAWAGEVRARGSTGVDACDRCGRLASAGYELKRCDKCNGPRYCSEACKEAAWEDDHREECETAAGTGTSSAAA